MSSVRSHALVVCVALTCATFVASAAWAQDAPPAPPAPPQSVEAQPQAAPMETSEAEVTQEATSVLPAEEGDEADPRYVTDNINIEGGIGFHRIASASAGAAPMFRAAFLGEFYAANNTVREEDDNVRTAGRLLVQGTVLEYLALNFGIGASANVNTYGQPQAMLSQGDLHLGAMGFYPITDYLTLASDLTLYVPTDFGDSGLDLSATSVRPRLLATLDVASLTDEQVPIDAHLNLGYRIDNSEASVPDGVELTRVERYAYGVSAYDLLEVGVGAELSLPYLRPFLGYWMGIPVNGADDVCSRTGSNNLDCFADQGFGAAPKYLSLGAKAEPIEHLGFHGGIDIGLTTNQAYKLPAASRYNLIFGVSWTIDPTPKVEYVEIERVIEKESLIEQAAQGFVVGTVVDAKSNAGVDGALISYGSEPVNPQASSGINGKFRSYGFEPGKTLTMRVTHPDYEPYETSVEVIDGELPLNIPLKAIPRVGSLKGRVLGSDNKPVISAVVTITGADNRARNVPVDPAGNFLSEIPAGDYTLAVRADGYLTSGRDIEIKAKDQTIVDVTLAPAPKEQLAELTTESIVIRDKVFFETGKSTILPRSYNLLDQVASILIENPQVKLVRVEGHTDDVGKAADNDTLSQERAQSVRQYLVQKGISASRLDAKGFGSRRPILPNTSNSARARNRRVEFNVVDPAPASSSN